MHAHEVRAPRPRQRFQHDRRGDHQHAGARQAGDEAQRAPQRHVLGEAHGRGGDDARDDAEEQ